MNTSQLSSLVRMCRAGATVEVELANPPLNLVTLAFLKELRNVLGRIAELDDVRCVILHGGKARVFCAGSDMREFAEVATSPSVDKILPEDLALRMLAQLPMPTIAALDGHALGGGLEIALACDLRVANEAVSLGLTESRIGGLAGSGAVRLARLIGPAKAKQMLFTGDPVAATEAVRIGLVNESTPRSAIGRARELAGVIAARGPLANRLAKQLVDGSIDMPLDAALLRSTTALDQVFRSNDLHAGAEAFFAKLEPVFTGS